MQNLFIKYFFIYSFRQVTFESFTIQTYLVDIFFNIKQLFFNSYSKIKLFDCPLYPPLEKLSLKKMALHFWMQLI